MLGIYAYHISMLRKRLKSEFITIRVTPQLKEKLIAEANEKDETVAAIIEEAIEQYFNETPTVLRAIIKLNKRIKALEKKHQNKKKGE